MNMFCLHEGFVLLGWVHCATEHRGESCACDGTVRYGHGTTWNEKTSSGSIACNNGVFGDPKPGYIKTCECMQTGTGSYTFSQAEKR